MLHSNTIKGLQLQPLQTLFLTEGTHPFYLPVVALMFNTVLVAFLS
jgi:hypothetical protein